MPVLYVLAPFISFRGRDVTDNSGLGRQRKKKCDEAKPSCLRCSRSSLVCKWPTEEQYVESHFCFYPDLGAEEPGNASRPVSQRKPLLSSSILLSAPTVTLQTDTDFYAVMPKTVVTVEWVLTQQRKKASPRYLTWHPILTPSDIHNLRTSSLSLKWDDTILLAHYENSVVPSYMQQGAHAQYHELKDIFLLIENHSSLKKAIMACAAMSLCGSFTEDRDWGDRMRNRALSFEASAINGMQADIEAGKVDGTEDWLLVSAMQLTLADVREHSQPSTSINVLTITQSLDHNASTPVIHMRGVMRLLQCREEARKSSRQYQPSLQSLIHERLCYEAILHHCLVLMLLDRNFSVIEQPWWKYIEAYFHRAPLSITPNEESWPILGMPFDLHRLAFLAHTLHRRGPLSSEDRKLALLGLEQLEFFHKTIPYLGRFSAGYTYLVAIDSLLKHLLVISDHDINPPKIDVSKIKENLEAGKLFVRFPLWPLSILYRISESDSDKVTLNKLIANALRNVPGPASKPAPQEAVDLFLLAPGLWEFHKLRNEGLAKWLFVNNLERLPSTVHKH